MSKVLIIYFSQNGSTEKIAKEIAVGLKKRNCDTTLINLLKNELKDISNYDIIGVGFPVYFFRPPSILMDFLKKLPLLNGKYYFVFKTFGSNPGAAANPVRKLLTKKGGREIGYATYMGEDYAYIYIKKGRLLCAGHPNKEELTNARIFGEDLIKNISEKNYKKQKYEKLKGFAYKFEYLVTSNFMVKKMYSRFYKVDKNLCDSCKDCIEVCPCDNIKLDSKGYPKWGRNCIFCWHCELICPLKAIKSPADWMIFKPFINHSLKASDKNPMINIAEVEYKKGEIIRK